MAYDAVRGATLSSLPDDGLRVYVGPCPYARQVLEQIESKRSPVVPLPVGELSDEERLHVCAVAKERLPALAGLLPDELLCAWLYGYADAFYQEHFITFPAASIGEVPVEREQLADELARWGLGPKVEGAAPQERALAGSVLAIPVGL